MGWIIKSPMSCRQSVCKHSYGRNFDSILTKKIKSSTLTVRRCDGEWYHLFSDFCCFRCVSHCMSPL